ncbi:hypothetical protein [Phenylobacterium sp.]|uniref:hypothetical protein n=1 Tax=Phenylobacterium sp. TaxID=1871053 RepID=UPI0025F7443D|nr:hypothetical protein [Phenylobacterium sp.]
MSFHRPQHLHLTLEAPGAVMKYCSGEPVRVCDRVALGGRPGIVVCSIDDGVYTPDHPATQWAYLEARVMIDFPDFGLIHYTEPEPDLRLTAREHQP